MTGILSMLAALTCEIIRHTTDVQYKVDTGYDVIAPFFGPL